MSRFATPPKSAQPMLNYHEAKLLGEASPGTLGLKAHMRQTRPRLDTASTMVPCSTELSFAASPFGTPRASVLNEGFMLPTCSLMSQGWSVTELTDAEAPLLVTPRAKTPQSVESHERFSTPPRNVPVRKADTPPPLVPKSRLPQAPLLRALKKNSKEEVQRALQQQPDAARQPFWEHNCEPPLCCAVRFQCDASIIKLLLDYQADPAQTDVRGNTPLQIAQRPKPDVHGRTHKFNFNQIAPACDFNQIASDMEMMLAGANVQQSDAPTPGGHFPPFPQAFDVQQFVPPWDVSGTVCEHRQACDDWQREVAALLGSKLL